ncbi:NAD(P)-dependent oxidoreductase [Kiloniella sp. EL199]|uniref:NAD(P)-dependent oxidoreductase n=1 Tax=Kiloniella sp. EL199 TaxID=2107581 RepID=UPI000EA1AB32|nr:NAD(P)-dependent oxidoreductase [Kiloniella sp. EL199]
MARIAFLGTGLMGTGMAGQLIDAGHNVHVYNRTHERAMPLVNRGATLATSPAMAAQDADAIFVMVGDDIASKAIWMGPEGVLSANLKPGTLAIECSTLSHDWIEELFIAAKTSGLDYLDCPVTGLPDAAANGQLTLFLGGEQSTIEKASPYLEVISSNQLYFGPVGSGTAYKLIVNLMGSIQIAAAAEGLIAAERAGLDLELVAKSLGMGGCGSPQVARNAPLMVEGQHEKDVLFSTKWRLKDTDYGLKYAHKLGLNPQIGSATLDAFQGAMDDGYSASAETKVIDALRKRLPR